ncbi:MAG: hypothetical protein DMF51_08115 [Acidobacteria bacterium]|nr:MAG: hypothetical protein DMF51_08115 [Acidobacteriota bacterium]
MTRHGASAIRVGISACLLGQAVRYDGGHKRDPIITETLGKLFEWVPVCPEVELGLGVPRESLALEGSPDAPRLVFRDTRADVTDRMDSWARRRLAEFETADLCGYILKSDSPSCGLQGVLLYEPGGSGPPRRSETQRSREGVGLFARALLERFPLLPVEDEMRLQAPPRRNEFVERVLSYRRSLRLRNDA